jgi:hypothetical protein
MENAIVTMMQSAEKQIKRSQRANKVTNKQNAQVS